MLEAVAPLDPKQVHAVIHPDMTNEAFVKANPQINWIAQPKPLGSGDAAIQALPHLVSPLVLILNGDGPLIRSETLVQCVEKLSSASLAIVSAKVADPRGYGRIIRDSEGELHAIVEDADLCENQRAVNEVNSGVVCTTTSWLKEQLPLIQANNEQQEIYLTDLTALTVQANLPVKAILAQHPEEIQGVNDHKQLAQAERIYQRRCADSLLEAGVKLADPNRVDIRGNIETGADCSIDINVVLEGEIKLHDGVQIGANCVLKNIEIGSGSTIHPHSIIEDSEIGKECSIGPFARIRPDSKVEDQARVGNFVELKKAHLKKGAKAGHLAYLGDAEIGENTNVGAGAITCNFDGAEKHRTKVGNGVFIGTNASLVAPIQINDGAFIAAGSTITKDVDENSFAIARARQRDIQDGAKKILKS